MTTVQRGRYHLGLTGWPLGHSLSPLMHSAALRAAGLEGDYNLFPARPMPEGAEDLHGLVNWLRTGELAGLNVTIPHKQSVIPLLDGLSPAVQAIGAVNTIVMTDSRLLGDNTDWAGFLNDLEAYLPDCRDGKRRQALVLGAGGSARAVVYALVKSDWCVNIAARRPEQSRDLSAKFSTPENPVTAHSMDEFDGLVKTRLIVNTTPVGMSPHVDASPWLNGLEFPPGALIYDLIYNPAETCLMRSAREAGLVAVNGLGMLAEQASLAFEIWTGHAVPVDIFRNAALERTPS
ncbi:MAG: shikimate dehydrogenase [Chloroflexi bacterium]|nr:shikimate dehydrogenase [Chloroflexota bacterium]BCY17569.1 shikimate dehydrogenase (NADP(+)) [Leptolinea sp. HRD-7]